MQVKQETDSDLLRDYTENRCESAFAELVRRHIALVYSVALRVVVDAHLAEDVTQATFATLAREARHLSGRAFLSSWLHRTASNQAAKLVRGEMRRRAREQEVYMQSVSSESDSDWKQIAPLLDVALNKLAEPDRAVILLRYFEKRTAGEIGSVLQVSEEAAQKRVNRALERLRGILAGGGVTLSTTALAALVTAQAVVAVPAGLSASVSATALTGGVAASGITLATLKLIIMSKLKISAVSALIVAGVATPLVIQHQNLLRLRDENQSLRQQVRQARLLRGEELSRQLSDARQSQGLSKAQFSELLRLRGQVGPLRRDSQELARLRAKLLAEQAASPPARPVAPDFVPAAAWANVGLDKPEAAIQTFFWAGKHGESNLIANLLHWQRDPAIPDSDELDQKFAQGIVSGTVRFAGKTEGYRVTSRQEDGDEARLGVDLTGPGGKIEPHTLRLFRDNGEWSPVMHVWLEGQGNVRAALDVPPKFRQAE